MIEEIRKQVEFARTHSNVNDARGAAIFKGKKILVVGFSHLPLTYHYTSSKSIQHRELHISAVQDAIIKIGSYRRVTYSDLDIAVSDAPTLQELALIVEMGFKTLWIPGEIKGLDPNDHFRSSLLVKQITF